MLVISTFLVNSAFNFALGLLVARFLGPQGFGQYAIAAAIAVVLNTLFLDWIRLAATRFYSNRTRGEDPSVRGTLDAVFILSSLGVVLTSAGALLLGLDFGLLLALAALAPAMGICNGLFDYHTALARARFEERTYSQLVIMKNTLSLLLMAGGAWWFQSPVIVGAGFVLSILATLLAARHRLVDPGVNILRPGWPSAGEYFIYGFPVILAAVIYFVIPLWNRTAIAGQLGFASSGQFSLGYDLAIRVVQTIGSALDVLLFQIAVRAEDENGLADAKRQMSANMGIILAAVTAVALGYWLVLPSFEAVLVPEAFRGPFAAVTTTLLPGLALFALIQAALTPVFQLGRRTWPAVVAALAALLCNALLTSRLGSSATIEDYAMAQAVSYGLAFAVAATLALRAMWVLPDLRDTLATLTAAVAMTAAVWPMRGWEPGMASLIASVVAGAFAFGATACLLNLANSRTLLSARLRRQRGS